MVQAANGLTGLDVYDDFEDNLLFVLNLLQENVGNHGVYPAEAEISDYLKSLYVN